MQPKHLTSLAVFLTLAYLSIFVNGATYTNKYNISPTAGNDTAGFNSTNDWYSQEVIGGGITDYYDSKTLGVKYNRVPTPEIREDTIGYINTSTIPSNAIINSANLTFYIDSYTATKDVVKDFRVRIYNLSGGGEWLNFNYSVFTSTGWNTVEINSSFFDFIYTGDNNYTRVKFFTDEPADLEFKTMELRAFEYENITGSYAMYMNITYTIPEGICDTDYDGTGNWTINENVNCTSANYDNRTIGGNIFINNSYYLYLNDVSLNLSLDKYCIQGGNNSVFQGRAY